MKRQNQLPQSSCSWRQRRHRRRACWLSLAGLAIACLGNAKATYPNERHALVFAPGKYDAYPDAPFHEQAARALQQRLQEVGVPKENIQLIVGAEATARRMLVSIDSIRHQIAFGDTLIVVLCSYGFQLGDEAYVAVKNSPDPIHEILSMPEQKGIRVSELLKDMAVATGTQQVLVVDGGASEMQEYDASSARFGRTVPVPENGQVVILNRGRKQSTRDGITLSDFMWSLLDGLDFHSDVNRDNQVSALELTRYMSLCAEDARTNLPRLAGNVSGEMQLFDLPAPEASQVTADFNRQSLQLLEEANQALFLELDAFTSLNLLDRARRLCRDETLLATINDTMLTARALSAGARLTWEGKFGLRSAEKLRTVVVHRPLNIIKPGTADVSVQIEVGSVVRVTQRFDDWLYVESAARPRVINGAFAFEPIEIQPGMVQLATLSAPDSRVVPSQYLQTQLARMQQHQDVAATEAELTANDPLAKPDRTPLD